MVSVTASTRGFEHRSGQDKDL